MPEHQDPYFFIASKIDRFLNDCHYFESYGFDVVGLILNIGLELRNQLHIEAENDNYLLRRAIERYFVELTNFFYKQFESPALSSVMAKNIGIDKYNAINEKVRKYKLFMLDLQKHFLSEQIEIVDDLYKIYST